MTMSELADQIRLTVAADLREQLLSALDSLLDQRAAAEQRAATAERELADMRPKYEALCAEVDRRDQEMAIANMSGATFATPTVTITTINLVDRLANAERDRDAALAVHARIRAAFGPSERAARAFVRNRTAPGSDRMAFCCTLCKGWAFEDDGRLSIPHDPECLFTVLIAVLAGQRWDAGG